MSFRIKNADKTIEDRIKKAINKKIFDKEVLSSRTQRMVDGLHQLLIGQFLRSETYFSLSGGALRAEFGLNDEEASKLPDLISELLEVKLNLTSLNMINGLVHWEIGISDNEDIDYSRQGIYISNGYIIPWLLWLLLMDEKTVVPDHKLYLKEGRGRSEMAIMIKSSTESYSVDGYFAGRPGNNWITETLRASKPQIMNLIKEAMGS